MVTELEKIFEVVKIKQVIRKKNVKFMEKIESPEAASLFACRYIGDEDREVFLVICLNTKMYVTAVHRCHMGSLTSVCVSVSDILKTCILNNASSFIVAHNHPSLSTVPSQQDLDVTNKLIQAGELLNIPLQDHVIVTATGDFTSIIGEYILSESSLLNKVAPLD